MLLILPQWVLFLQEKVKKFSINFQELKHLIFNWILLQIQDNYSLAADYVCKIARIHVKLRQWVSQKFSHCISSLDFLADMIWLLIIFAEGLAWTSKATNSTWLAVLLSVWCWCSWPGRMLWPQRKPSKNGVSFCIQWKNGLSIKPLLKAPLKNCLLVICSSRSWLLGSLSSFSKFSKIFDRVSMVMTTASVNVMRMQTSSIWDCCCGCYIFCTF